MDIYNYIAFLEDKLIKVSTDKEKDDIRKELACLRQIFVDKGNFSFLPKIKSQKEQFKDFFTF